MITIKYHPNICIGCQACVSVCDNWIVKGTKVRPKRTKLIKVGCNEDAINVCPVGAIEIK